MGGHEITPEQMEDRLDFVEASPIDSLYICEEGAKMRQTKHGWVLKPWCKASMSGW